MARHTAHPFLLGQYLPHGVQFSNANPWDLSVPPHSTATWTVGHCRDWSDPKTQNVPLKFTTQSRTKGPLATIKVLKAHLRHLGQGWASFLYKRPEHNQVLGGTIQALGSHSPGQCGPM